MAHRRSIQKNNTRYSQSFYRRFLGFSIGILVFSLGFYVFSINMLASRGYEMRSAEKQVSELSDQYRDLQVQVAESSALHHIERVSAELELAQPEEVRYVKEAGPVALK